MYISQTRNYRLGLSSVQNLKPQQRQGWVGDRINECLTPQIQQQNLSANKKSIQQNHES